MTSVLVGGLVALPRIFSRFLCALKIFRWCGPCRTLAPVLSDAVRAAGKVSLLAYDIDESSERAEELQVSAVPSVVAFCANEINCFFIYFFINVLLAKGKKIGEFRGALPAPKVAEFIEDVKRKHATSE